MPYPRFWLVPQFQLSPHLEMRPICWVSAFWSQWAPSAVFDSFCIWIKEVLHNSRVDAPQFLSRIYRICRYHHLLVSSIWDKIMARPWPIKAQVTTETSSLGYPEFLCLGRIVVDERFGLAKTLVEFEYGFFWIKNHLFRLSKKGASWRLDRLLSSMWNSKLSYIIVARHILPS